MMTIRHLLIAVTASIALTSTSFADVLTIGVGQQAADKQAMSRPYKGMERQDVLSSYGNPLRQTSAIGEPPISNWEFSEFTVYFEYNHVIHSVLHDDASNPIQ